jgi:hypothetical protein
LGNELYTRVFSAQAREEFFLSSWRVSELFNEVPNRGRKGEGQAGPQHSLDLDGDLQCGAGHPEAERASACQRKRFRMAFVMISGVSVLIRVLLKFSFVV